MKTMELVQGPEQPGLLVKMLQETRGKTCRTKYMIRMKAEDEEIPEPVPLPDGGFLVPLPLDRGSSDSTKPQLPSPGDIRRMFGNDKIDCEPEYTITMDPDWSGVSPTTTADAENKVRDNETTNALLRRYREIEDKRKQLKNCRRNRKFKSRSVSEGVKRKTFKQEGKRNNSDIFFKRKKTSLGVCNRSDLLPTTSAPLKQQGGHENNLSSSNVCIQENGGDRITFTPSRLNRKSYNTAINVVQRMNTSHWLIIDNLYNDIKRENGTNFEHFNNLVSKIVQEIYGIDCEFILSTIHPDLVQRIVKLGKVMLNIYHQAVFGSNKNSKPLSAAGTRNKNFSQKCIQVYTTFSPCKYQSKTTKSKMYRNLFIACSPITKPRCMACFLKNKVNEKNTKLNQGKLSNRNNQIKKSNIKSYVKSKLSANKSNKISVKRSDKSKNQAGLSIDNNSMINKNNKVHSYDEKYVQTGFNTSSDLHVFSDEFLQAVSDIPEFNGSEPTEQMTWEEIYEAATSDEDLLVTETKAASSVTSLEKEFKSYSNEVVLERFDQVVGGGDVSTSNDYNFLSSLYNDSSSEFMEVSNNISSTQVIDSLGPAKKDQAKEYLTTTENLIFLNNLLEKTLLHENDDTSRSVKEMNADTENESYHDCEASFIAMNNPENGQKNCQTKAKKKCYRQLRWMQLRDDCIHHKSSVSAFLALIVGLITVYFWRGSFVNKCNNVTVKDSIKQVIKTFLLGMKYEYAQNY